MTTPRTTGLAWQLERLAARVAGARRGPRARQALRRAVEGRVVVVSGASGGIGADVARDCGAAGAQVVLVARTREKLEAVATEVEAAGGAAHVVPADLSDAEEVDRVVKEVLAHHDHVDVVVANAGRSIRRGVLATVERTDDLDRVMALNFFGSARLVLGLLPSMVEQGRGHVVAVTTIGTLLHVPRFATYLASKSALEQFTRVLGTEMAPHGVTASVVHMPLVRTDMIAPSSVWRRHVAMNADEGAALVTRAIARRPHAVSMGVRPVAMALDALAPRLFQSAWARRLRH